MKGAISLLIFLQVFAFVSARNVTGVVMNEERKPEPFVNVMLLTDSTFIDGTVTDDAGTFLFKDVDNKADSIKISILGYQDLLLPIPADGRFGTISLTPTSVILNDVVVKATLPSIRLKGNAIVTGVENSVLATTGTANDVLKNVPMLTGGNGNFSVFGRGDAVIYINGRIVRNPNDVGQLASSNIKEVQVITNPGAEYGADVNAVIKIVTKKPVGDGFGLSVYSDNVFNKWFTTSDQLDLKYRTGGLEIFALGNVVQSKNFEDEYVLNTTNGNTVLANGRSILSTVSKESVGSIKTVTSGKIGFNYQFNRNHSLGAYYQNDYNHGHHAGHYLNSISENGMLVESSVSDLKGWFKMLPGNSANIYYNGTVGKFTFDLNADYMQTKDKDRAFQYEINEFSDDRTVTTYNVARNRLFAEKATVAYQLLKGSVMVGEEYTNSRSRNDFQNPENILESEKNDVRESNIGVFAEVSQSFGDLSASAGLRYEHVKSDYYINNSQVEEQSKSYNNFFPSANVSYSPGDFRFSLSYSYRTVRPTYQNLNGNYFYVNSILYSRGNPYLVPSKRQEFTAQTSWKYLTLSAQYSFTRDVIAQVYEPYQGNDRVSVFTVTNMSEHKLFSVYLNAAPQFGIYHPSVSVGMQKQWFDVDYLGQNKRMNSPIFTIQMNNTFTFPHDWFVEASFWWRSHGDWKNWTYTQTFSTVDVRVYKMFLNKSLTVYVGANDIFNGLIYKANVFSGNVMMISNVNNHKRNAELTVRYNFNTSKSHYKGTGAGTTEKQRF